MLEEEKRAGVGMEDENGAGVGMEEEEAKERKSEKRGRKGPGGF